MDGKPKVALRDIVCYKIFDYSKGRLITPFRGMEIEPTLLTVNGGSIRAEDFQTVPITWLDGRRNINVGIHSLRKITSYKKMAPYMNCVLTPVIVRCVIPAGTRYWIGNNNDYCSEELVISGMNM